MSINWPILLLASIIPLLIGAIWYNPKFLGTAWMKETGLTEEELKKANMAKIFGLTFLFSFLIAMTMQFVVIHQYHVYSIFANETGLNDSTSEISVYYKDFMDKYGNNFRTFKHGLFHGVLFGIFFGLPLMGVNALFERKSFKYIFIHAGFWTVCFALMGGVICAFA